MKIVFLSNFYNHHQSGISHKLNQLTHEYTFIETTAVPKERLELGYQTKREQFILDCSQHRIEAEKFINDADVLIFGSGEEALLANRKRNRKLIFRYSEHLFKNGNVWWKFPLRWYRAHRNNPSKSPIYMLCASAYTARDYQKLGLFKNKVYKWGYFPECKRYNSVDDLFCNKNTCEIIWCGRFLDWKHPDDVLKIAKRLKEERYDFHITLIGTGQMEQKLREFVSDNNLEDFVSFLGSMSPQKVREFMERAGIFLFTSDHKEGWGAVLNEGMNSGCAVVASNAAGSSLYLINHGVNGYLYHSGDIEQLYSTTKFLLDNPKEQRRLGESAYNTILCEWNADIAAERLCSLSKSILKGDTYPDIYKTGPCSKA